MPAALRYTFEYDDGAVRVLRRLALDKQTASYDKTLGTAGQSGFWVELRDARGAVVYRRVMDDPLFRYEAPANDTGALTNVTAASRRGIFSVVVPFDPAARTLVVMASRPADRPAVPVFTTSITATV